MPTSKPILFLDTEATGLDPALDGLWELAVIRREPDGTETEYEWFVNAHVPSRAALLPEPFKTDYATRYRPDLAITGSRLVLELDALCRDRPYIVGAVPSFDMNRIGRLRERFGFTTPDPWHYHLKDVENVAIGFLNGLAAAGDRRAIVALSQDLDDSDAISLAVGVDPADFARHTALGDARWAKAIYDAVMTRG